MKYERWLPAKQYIYVFNIENIQLCYIYFVVNWYE